MIDHTTSSVPLAETLAECTAALEQRNAELAIINSVQQGLAQQLDMQVMYELVGDKLRDIFDAQVLGIYIYDPQTNLLSFPYMIECCERFYLEPTVLKVGGFTPYMIRNRQPLMFNTNVMQRATEFGSYILGDTQVSKSYLGAPLVVGNEARGAIVLENIDRENAFSESDMRLLSTLASSLSVALENARLFAEARRLLAETEQRNAELATVNRIGQALASELELDALINLIGDQICQTFAADIVYVALHDRQTDMLDFVYGYGEQLSSVRFGEGLISRIIQTRLPLLINEGVMDRHSTLHVAPVGASSKSYLGVPIMVGEEAIGVISVQSTQQEGRFGEADVHLLTTVAANVGVAIQNARLYQETQRSAREMAALAEVGRDVSATLDLPTVLERIACHAKELLSADTSAVFLPEPGGRTFRAITVLGTDAAAIQSETIALGEGIIGGLALRGAAEIIHDTPRDPRTRHIPGTAQNPQEHLMVAPLLAGERVSGMMAVWRMGQHNLFTETDLSFLSGLARQAAIAIENARLFEEAQHARAQAETANVAKSTFLANMSHELRTPLNAVLGFAQVMERDQTLSRRQREHLGIITHSGEHLLSLINGVLETAKIEAGRVTLNQTTFDLHELFRSVEELFRLRAEARHLYLLFHIAPEVPRYVHGDESKLRQVLINLIGNAIKFTHQGGVTLRAYWHDERPTTKDQGPIIDNRSSFVLRPSSLVVEVADSGEGIAQDQQPDLFEAFVQTASGAKVQEGTGLGLAISRQFVRLMSGDISVKSTVGAGSTFCFDMQLAAADRSEVQDRLAERRVVGIDPNDRQEYRMLVVDDKLENRRLLVEWLRMTGFQVREASNGAEALKAWDEWAPQMIWMDMRMPVLDGYEATRRIKASLQGQATVVVALTASAFEHEETMVLSAGCDDFVRKPVRESLIFEKIAQHLGIRFVYQERQPSTAAEDGATRLTPEHLAALPSDWVANLRQAILVADMDQVKMLIDQIGDRDRALANELLRLADNFQIDQLQVLVQ